MLSPLVSVIVPNYNYGCFLREAIDSALAQTYPNKEIIAVDDGSTDDSRSVLQSYGERIRWVEQANAGVSAARNRGVKESKGELLAFLDSDDMWLSTKLEKQVSLMISGDDIGLVHCGYEEVDSEGRILHTELNGLDGRIAEEILLLRRSAILVAGSGALVRRGIFESVGGFDEALPPSEDWEIGFQVARKSRIGFIPEPLLKYRIHGGNNHLKIHRMERAMLRAFKKIFREPDGDIRRLKRRAYGRLHSILAGSFFHARQYGPATRHLVCSLFLTPTSCARWMMGFPRRFWQRHNSRNVYLAAR